MKVRKSTHNQFVVSYIIFHWFPESRDRLGCILQLPREFCALTKYVLHLREVRIRKDIRAFSWIKPEDKMNAGTETWTIFCYYFEFRGPCLKMTMSSWPICQVSETDKKFSDDCRSSTCQNLNLDQNKYVKSGKIQKFMPTQKYRVFVGLSWIQV